MDDGFAMAITQWWLQMAFNRAEKTRTNRLSAACLIIQTAFRRYMFEHEYQVKVSLTFNFASILVLVCFAVRFCPVPNREIEGERSVCHPHRRNSHTRNM